MLRAGQWNARVQGDVGDRSQTTGRESNGANRRPRGSWAERSDSRYLPRRWTDHVAEVQVTSVAQRSQFVSAAQSEIGDVAPQPQMAGEDAANGQGETDRDATPMGSGHVTPVVD